MLRIRLTLFLTISMALLSGCGDDGAPDSGSDGGEDIDLASIDACSFFDVATIQKVTGEDEVFVDSGRADPSTSACFWGANQPGVPAYVELSISRYGGDIAAFVDPDCSVSAVDTEEDVDSAGVTCPPDPQRKIYLLVGDQGVKVSLLVNEPNRPLTPEDLVPFAESVVETL